MQQETEKRERSYEELLPYAHYGELNVRIQWSQPRCFEPYIPWIKSEENPFSVSTATQQYKPRTELGRGGGGGETPGAGD